MVITDGMGGEGWARGKGREGSGQVEKETGRDERGKEGKRKCREKEGREGKRKVERERQN